MGLTRVTAITDKNYRVKRSKSKKFASDILFQNWRGWRVTQTRLPGNFSKRAQYKLKLTKPPKHIIVHWYQTVHLEV